MPYPYPPLNLYTTRSSAVGEQAEEIVAHGGLLPDELMLKVVSSKLDLVNNKVARLSSPFLLYTHGVIIRSIGY